MSKKRSFENDATESSQKKRKTGFQVGPANLPDGTYRRKVQKIKHNLVRKAQLKKDLARAIAQEESNNANPTSTYDDEHEAPAMEIHPDRQAMMDAPAEIDPIHHDTRPSFEHRTALRRRPKQNPLEREAAVAQKRKEEAEARQQARDDAQKEWRRKIDERNRLRKAMEKARQPDKNGQRRLGRESVVLLEKVKRMMGNG